MKVSQDYVPGNLEECIDDILNHLTQADIDHILDKHSDPLHEQFNFGMCIRSEWSLWDSQTTLVQWFKANHGISFADDISKLILDCLWHDIRNKPRRIKSLCRHFLRAYENNNS